MNPIVSVIIPAYNAQATIAATIGSVQAQSLGELEIVVVDDGSVDETAGIVAKMAASDPRIHLIRQDNAGVAAARNAAMARAGGRFIATLDSDDIWHPEKLAAQVEALAAAPADTGIVYCWYRRIDAIDHVFPGSSSPRIEGPVLHQHLEWNFISNGSAPMMPAELARSVGYDTSLLQGCEDYMFQLRIAQAHRFHCVPAYLVGYRYRPDSLSRATENMLLGHLQMYAILDADLADNMPARKIIAWRKTKLLVELSRNQLRKGHVAAALAAFGRAVRTSPGHVPGSVLVELRNAQAMFAPPKPPSAPTRPFLSYSIDESDGDWAPRRSEAYLARLRRLDWASAGPSLPG
ncbi:glycosyltransferase family 2 protein [Sphingobium sp. CAP-1]|uniref:glycosyltransferase family 2 protein n=1 Tax=Sphingobium sp. CAP-1 TaxID=2676077 RepID=UPI0012BB2A23|nr:glycosyltransferase family A protein [Sphingobium sp. CAP-1]QGP78183.1 glycosyltransferase [Sphingobium sp. CAP-1]